MNDPVVEEVRKTRQELWAKFDNDPKKYFEHLASMEQELRAQGFLFVGDKTAKAAK